MRRAPLTAFLTAAALAACYHNSGYTTAPPNPILPPANLTYELVPSGDPTTPVGILLRWDPSTDTRVNAYNVYSRPSANAAWGLRAMTTSASFYDLGIPDLQYQVTATDVNGIESVASNAITVSASGALPSRLAA